MKKRLALTKDGRMTYCTATEENIGKGRCNHIAHQKEGQTEVDFVEEANKIWDIKEDEKNVKVSFDENDNIKIEYAGSVIKTKNKDFLFENKNGTYQPTEYAKYIILSQGKKMFSRLICELDKDFKYHRESFVDVVDPDIFYERKSQYTDNKKVFEELVSKWKEENMEKFENVPYIPSIQRYARNFSFNKEITLEEAVQGYKYCNQALKNIDRDKIQLGSKIMIKPEYNEEYINVCKEFRKKAGFPTDSEIKMEIKDTIKEKRTRLALDRKRFENPGATEEYAKSYVSYLANSDFSGGYEYARY